MPGVITLDAPLQWAVFRVLDRSLGVLRRSARLTVHERRELVRRAGELARVSAGPRLSLGSAARPGPSGHVPLHGSRHTHASLAIDAGMPISVVSVRLGQVNASITLGVYAHQVRGSQTKAANPMR
jgi:integrase